MAAGVLIYHLLDMYPPLGMSGMVCNKVVGMVCNNWPDSLDACWPHGRAHGRAHGKAHGRAHGRAHGEAHGRAHGNLLFFLQCAVGSSQGSRSLVFSNVSSSILRAQ